MLDVSTGAEGLSTISVLGLGLTLGLRHALDADHLAAVSTMISERKSVFSSVLVGGLWGIGHTAALMVAGVAVILFRVEISEQVASVLEFAVALMLIGLGLRALWKLCRGGYVHFHAHEHGDVSHVHPHIHTDQPAPTTAGTHHGLGPSLRPVLVGMVHGLAGTAALMLLVLSTISSGLVAISYILIFGIGSIGGMMLMSSVVGLPLHLTQIRFAKANLVLRILAGVFCLGFGLHMAYEIGFVDGLLR